MAKKKVKVKKNNKDEALIFCCEATGKKVKFQPGKLDLKALARGELRVWSSHEVADAHMKMEKRRGGMVLHRNAVYADPKRNVRRFDISAQKFVDLMNSIKEQGILQPLIVKRSVDHAPASYKLIAGFRRFEAATQLEMEHVPVTITEDTASEKVVGMLENLNRESMTPMEKAAGLQAIKEEGYIDKKTGAHKKYSQRGLAKVVGMAQSQVSGYLGLLDNTHKKVAIAVSNGSLPLSKAQLITQLPKEHQAKEIKMMSKLDIKEARQHIKDRRKILGIEEPRHKGKDKKPTSRLPGRKIKLRNVGDIVKAMLAAEKAYFSGKSKKTATGKAKVAYLQWVCGLLETPKDAPIDPVEFEKAAEEAKAKKVEALKKAREVKQKKTKKGSKKSDKKTAPAKKRAKKDSKKTKLPEKKSKKGSKKK